jgi:hypothetical protein
MEESFCIMCPHCSSTEIVPYLYKGIIIKGSCLNCKKDLDWEDFNTDCKGVIKDEDGTLVKTIKVEI